MLMQIIRLPFLYSCRLHLSLLASSLAVILPRFPLFSGHVRTTKDGYFAVAYTNQGACIQYASSIIRLSDLLPAGTQPSSTLNTTHDGASGEHDGPSTATSMASQKAAAAVAPFKPPNLVPFYPDTPPLLFGFINKDIPILHAKLTHLADGGSCLVVAVPHVLADLDTCKTLITAWTEEYSAQEARSENGGDAGHLSVVAEKHPHQHVGGHGHEKKQPTTTTQQAPLAAEALAAHAAPTLPPGYVCSKFEDRSFSFYPKMLGFMVYNVIVAGGTSYMTTLAYHVPAARLAQLKTEASNGLQRAGAASPGWISTNDALAARVWQALAQLPPKANSKLYYVINLRKRLRPALPSGALGNCAWYAQVGEDQDMSPATTSLGEMAAAVRKSVLGLDLQEVSHSIRWGEDHLGSGKTMPVVVRRSCNILLQSGAIMYSNWEWDKEYRSAAFGNGIEAAPVWHQPMEALAPNCVFTLPAPPALPGDGSVVFITLHKKLAVAFKSICPAL